MNNRFRGRVQALRNLIMLSPRITVLSAIVLVVFMAMIGVGVAVIQQSEAAGAVLEINNVDVNRPFVQLQRETLRLITVVRADPDKYDKKAADTQRSLVESRMVVLHYPLVKGSLPPESQQATTKIDGIWAELQPLLDQWQANPADTAIQENLGKTLVEFEALANNSEIRFQLLRRDVVQAVGQASRTLLLVLGSMSLLLLVFIGIVIFSVYRFVIERQKAEEEKLAAKAAEAAALETNSFKDQFLAVMSHELRTPLNAIIGFLGLLGMSKSLEERNLHMVQRARANAERLLTLINDILDLSKIESGRLELVPTAVAPRDLAERWESQMDVLAKQKGVDFIVNVDGSLPERVLVDEDAITKIVTNLMSNAFKFTEKGQVSLKMNSQGGKWVIEVKDTGIGIPGHMHETIFEAFRQVDGSSRRAYGGTGLGLSIVERLCKAMNGTIRLESTMGVGSTFTVMLPLVVAADKPIAAKQAVGVST